MYTYSLTFRAGILVHHFGEPQFQPWKPDCIGIMNYLYIQSDFQGCDFGSPFWGTTFTTLNARLCRDLKLSIYAVWLLGWWLCIMVHHLGEPHFQPLNPDCIGSCQYCSLILRVVIIVYHLGASHLQPLQPVFIRIISFKCYIES